MLTYVVVSGNVVSGFLFWGPFDSAELAHQYGERRLGKDQWTVVAVIAES